MIKKKMITFRLSPEAIAEIRHTAARFGTSQAKIVEVAIMRECARMKREKSPLFD